MTATAATPGCVDEHLLALGRVEVHPAGHDHVGDPVGDEDVAVGVDVADVAEGEDARCEIGLGRLLRVGVVARAAPVGRAEPEDADLAGRHRLVLLVEDDDLERRARAADRAAVREPLGRVDAAQRAALAAAVGLDEDRAEPLDHRQLGVGRAGRAGLADQLQAGRRRTSPRTSAGRASRRCRWVGTITDEVTPVRLDQAQHRLGVEPAEHDDRLAGEQVPDRGQRRVVLQRPDDEVRPGREGRLGGDRRDVLGGGGRASGRSSGPRRRGRGRSCPRCRPAAGAAGARPRRPAPAGPRPASRATAIAPSGVGVARRARPRPCRRRALAASRTPARLPSGR